MASLLAGARLVLRQGARFFPSYRVRPAAAPVRCLAGSARFLTTAVPEISTIKREPLEPRAHNQSRFDGWSIHYLGVKLKKDGRISKQGFIKVLEGVCEKGALSNSQSSLLLHICGSSLPGVPMAERIEIANRVWNKLQELGVVFTEDHYNELLKIYIENEHKFSPTEFLAGMEAAGVQPDQVTYERLIGAYCNEGDIEGASNILGFLKSRNLPITEGVFCFLIRGHARAGDMESAQNVLSVMQESGLAPRGSTYAELLCAYAEKGDIGSIKQILLDCKPFMSEPMYLTVIYSLARAGHGQLVPDIFEHMPSHATYTRQLINLSLNLLAQGCGDTALEVVKRFISKSHSEDFFAQPGSFFIRQCVELNLPFNLLKKYLSELKDSNLHPSPLQFALLCALEEDKKDMALELMKSIQEEGLPLRPHYFWPMLASCYKNDDVQGCLRVLQTMQKMKTNPDLDTFCTYVVDLFAKAESPESILQESGFQDTFNDLYLSSLRLGLINGQLKRVYMLLSSQIPFNQGARLMTTFKRMFFRYKDVESLAKITKLLCQNRFKLPKSSPETDSVGYFLCGLIVSVSDSEVQAGEEHLKQYFHQLKNMDVTLEPGKAERIISALRDHKVPQLFEDVKQLVTSSDLDQRTSDLEEKLENERANGLPIAGTIRDLLHNLVEQADLEKVLELTSKYSSEYSFPMYLKVLGLCCKKNNPIEALKVKEELSQREFSLLPSTMKYLQLVKVLALNDHMEDAINILKEMQERNVTVNKDSHKACVGILHALAKNGDVDGVNRLHDSFVILGLAQPTSMLCEPLVEVHLYRNDLPAALDAFIDCDKKYKYSRTHKLLLKLIESEETELLKKAVEYLYNTSGERIMLHSLLFAFLDSGNYQEAQKIAETSGFRAIPSIIQWNTENYSKQNKVEALEKCLEITNGVFEIDRADLYYKLLSVYERNNEWAKAIPLWKKMNEEGIPVQEKNTRLFLKLLARNDQDLFAHIPELKKTPPEAITTRQVINLCNEGKFNEACDWILRTSKTNRPLTKVAYAKVLKGLLEAELLEDALKVEEVAKRHYKDYSIRNVSYNILLTEQVRRDCLKEALVTLKKVLDNDGKPGHLILHSLSESFALKGDIASLEEMEELTKSNAKTPPNIDSQYGKFKLLAHFVNGSFDECISAIESHYTEVPKNVQVFNLLLTLKKKNMSEALENVGIVAERMANQFSNYKLVTDMFLLHVKSNEPDEAKLLLQRYNGILEQKELLKTHINVKCSKGQEAYIYQVLTLLAEHDPFYKQFGYNVILKKHVSARKLDAALKIYKRMKDEAIEPDENSLKKLEVLRNVGRLVPLPKEPQDSVQYSNEEQSNTLSPSEEKH